MSVVSDCIATYPNNIIQFYPRKTCFKNVLSRKPSNLSKEKHFLSLKNIKPSKKEMNFKRYINFDY